jgi:exodeoxyribonuclease VII large subunit
MEKNILSVTELTSKISRLLDEGIGTVRVSGEVSNFKAHSSGHRYFTLKDEGAQISCTVWRSRPVNLAMADGMQVEIEGSISVYAPRGQYQIDCTSVRRAGVGNLFAKFEKLKLQLTAEGLFDRESKKALPKLALRIGVSTSETGAAVRDIFSTVKRRFPAAVIYFRPTAVQGVEATGDVVKAIAELDSLGLDVIIIGRGGGSIEDLWAFNEEAVARAIFNARTPIVSAVGHETDFTIADFVADYRAATPTAAAETVTLNTAEEIIEKIDSSADFMTRSVRAKLSELRSTLDRFSTAYSVRKVKDTVQNFSRLVDESESKLKSSVSTKLEKSKMLLNHAEALCLSHDPMLPLDKGYALLKSDEKYILSEQSLEGINQIKIVRNKEIAEAEIKNVIIK